MAAIETLILLTPIGRLFLRLSDKGLRWIEILPDTSNAVPTAPRMYSEAGGEVCRQIDAYFASTLKRFDLPIDWSVFKPFQINVMRLLAELPFGQVTTYGVLAERLGKPNGARAVGIANATNPVPIVLPCHRVIASDGSMQGYRAPLGILTKEWLLRHEGHTIRNHKLANDQPELFPG
ncbi:MAG: methylated-DNA--[protein]-cysteine S-methyltransferase [Anaerolineaceae bacterium]|jgi:methylated-DNA-[protein]-cysteine S-methyltransferase